MQQGRLEELLPGLGHVDDVPFVELLFVGQADAEYILRRVGKYQQGGHDQAVGDSSQDRIFVRDYLHALNIIHISWPPTARH